MGRFPSQIEMQNFHCEIYFLILPFTIKYFYQMNQMELSPNYSGTLRGFSNTFGNITGFVAPLVAGAIITNNVRLKYWGFKRISFF